MLLFLFLGETGRKEAGSIRGRSHSVSVPLNILLSFSMENNRVRPSPDRPPVCRIAGIGTDPSDTGLCSLQSPAAVYLSCCLLFFFWMESAFNSICVCR